MATSSEQPDVAQTAETDRSHKRRLCLHGFRFLWLILLFASILLLWIPAGTWLQDRSIEKRLIGTWTSDHVQADGSVNAFITQFHPDGTMHHFDGSKPWPENGSPVGRMGWCVSGGNLMLEFTERPVSAKARIRWVMNYVTNCFGGKKMSDYDAERCLMDDTKGDSITITTHPDTNESASWVGGTWLLMRVD